jgi:chloramphenicol 3-O phosphotransferase
MTAGPGRIVILNGAPRSGKSSIVALVQATIEGRWMNLGVDVARQMTPPRLQPGIGLRPGGERPDLEASVAPLYGALYDSVAAHSRHGLDVVVDVGHHDDYSRPLGILTDAARRLSGLPVLFVGVRCPIEVIMQRRDSSPSGRYERSALDGTVPDPVLRWQAAVHVPGIYDLEVDTSQMSAEECALRIRGRLRDGPPGSALAEAARRSAGSAPT